MSPRNITLNLIDEVRALPDISFIDLDAPMSRNIPGHYTGSASWGDNKSSPRYLVVPEFAWTDKELLVWLHELGHLRTLRRGRAIKNDRDWWNVEVLAWRWARATLGERWTPEMARIARLYLNSYKKYFKERAFLKRKGWL